MPCSGGGNNARHVLANIAYTRCKPSAEAITVLTLFIMEDKRKTISNQTHIPFLIFLEYQRRQLQEDSL